MKNTVSAIDTIIACGFLVLLRLATGTSDRPFREKLRWAAPPGVFVSLGTAGNFFRGRDLESPKRDVHKETVLFSLFYAFVSSLHLLSARS